MTPMEVGKMWDACNVAYEPPLPRGLRRAGFVVDDAIILAAATIVAAMPVDLGNRRRERWIEIILDETK